MNYTNIRILILATLPVIFTSGCYHPKTHVKIHDPAKVSLFIEKNNNTLNQVLGPSEDDEIAVAYKSGMLVTTLAGMGVSTTVDVGGIRNEKDAFTSIGQGNCIPRSMK